LRSEANIGPTRRHLLAGLVPALLLAGGGRAAAVGRDDLIGANAIHTVRGHETLVDIAVAWGMGYVELAAANPDIDPWLPGIGSEVVIPDLHVLPDAPRIGIVINLAELRLYHFRPGGGVRTMPVGIGTDNAETPLGETSVVGMRRNPTWWPPESIRAKRPDLPAAVPPGPDNPMGAYSLDLGWPLYRIHGTNRPYGVGRRVSHGCIRMYPQDIEALFARVTIGTPVRIVDQPIKLGWSGGDLYLEVHPTQREADLIEAGDTLAGTPAETPAREIFTFMAASGVTVPIRWPVVVTLARERRGVPGLISARAASAPAR